MDFKETIKKLYLKNLIETEAVAEDEMIVDDEIRCIFCNKPRAIRKYSSIAERDIWSRHYENGERILCDCQRTSMERSIVQNKHNDFMAIYNNGIYSRFTSRLFKDTSFEWIRQRTANYSSDFQYAIGRIEGFCINHAKVKECGKGFFLHSSIRGNYKTSILASVRNKLLEYEEPVLLSNLDMFLDENKASYNDFSRKDVEKYYSVDFLLLDDIGCIDKTDSNSEWKANQIHKLIDYRYRNCLTTCFSSQYNISEMYNRGLKIETCDRIRDLAPVVLTYKDSSARGSIENIPF